MLVAQPGSISHAVSPEEVERPRPRGFVLLSAALMAAGAFGPWIAERLAGGTTGVTLGGDGWLVVIAAGAAVMPVILGFTDSLVGFWLLANALAGGLVCFIHYQQDHNDGFKSGWGLELASIGCVMLAVAGLRWFVAPKRTD
jgi:hypothetical protein